MMLNVIRGFWFGRRKEELFEGVMDERGNVWVWFLDLVFEDLIVKIG